MNKLDFANELYALLVTSMDGVEGIMGVHDPNTNAWILAVGTLLQVEKFLDEAIHLRTQGRKVRLVKYTNLQEVTPEMVQEEARRLTGDNIIRDISGADGSTNIS